jgi:hypothetical protein
MRMRMALLTVALVLVSVHAFAVQRVVLVEEFSGAG